MGGVGGPAVGSPPLCEPPLPPSVLPTTEGLVEADTEKRARPQAGGIDIRWTQVQCLMPPLPAGDGASDFLPLSLGLLLCITGCRHKAVSAGRQALGGSSQPAQECCRPRPTRQTAGGGRRGSQQHHRPCVRPGADPSPHSATHCRRDLGQVRVSVSSSTRRGP